MSTPLIQINVANDEETTLTASAAGDATAGMDTMTKSFVAADSSGAQVWTAQRTVEMAPCRIAACVDPSSMAGKVTAHAVAVAKALRAELTLIRVLEARPAGEAPADPVEWELRRREARDSVESMVEAQNDTVGPIKAEVIEGQAAEQIRLWARNHNVDLTVLCTHGEGDPTSQHLGNTARRVAD